MCLQYRVCVVGVFSQTYVPTYGFKPDAYQRKPLLRFRSERFELMSIPSIFEHPQLLVYNTGHLYMRVMKTELFEHKIYEPEHNCVY